MAEACRRWVRTKVINPFVDYLKQDIGADVLARSATMGFFLGLCPIVGVSTLFCAAICFVFSKAIYAPMALLLNFIAVPIEVALIVPFMRFGEFVLQAPRLDVVPQHFSDLFRAGAALKGLGHAVLGWLLLSVLLVWMKAARHGDGDDSLLASSDQEDVEMGNSGSLSVRPTLSPRASRDTIRTSGNEPHL